MAAHWSGTVQCGPAPCPATRHLAAQGIYTDAATGIRVFAGQRAETFYIDLGAVFDTLNLRRYLPLLTGAGEDNDNVNPYGVNRFSGANVSTIAIEMPITRITSDGKPAATSANPVIGMYASTARQKVRVLPHRRGTLNNGPWVQVSRMANPLVNELIINTPAKDAWNAAEPESEAQFQRSTRTRSLPRRGARLWRTGRADQRFTKSNRTDLMSILLKYPGQALAGSNCNIPCANCCGSICASLRRHREPEPAWRGMSADPAGWPNGRRPNDDVTDIAIRVVGGTNYIANKAGDGVNFLAGARAL